MTQMLASVSSLEEATMIAPLGINILDLKNPSRGALGALDVSLVRQIVDRFPSQTVSATVGDLPMDPALIAEAVQEMTKTGVNYIKIGFFPEADLWLPVLERLRPIMAQGHRLIAVLFADQPIDLALLPAFAAAGFCGIMVDTADKVRGGLLVHRDAAWLQGFVRAGRDAGLLTGLAGSLSPSDIPTLKSIGPDYLGFRGALCTGGRSGHINPDAVQRVRETVMA